MGRKIKFIIFCWFNKEENTNLVKIVEKLVKNNIDS